MMMVGFMKVIGLVIKQQALENINIHKVIVMKANGSEILNMAKDKFIGQMDLVLRECLKMASKTAKGTKNGAMNKMNILENGLMIK